MSLRGPVVLLREDNRVEFWGQCKRRPEAYIGSNGSTQATNTFSVLQRFTAQMTWGLFFSLPYPGLTSSTTWQGIRALLQRCKKEDSNSPHDFPGMRVNNGWREWDNLDALFESMGPNPLVMSEDLGPQVARGYQHSSNIATSFDWTTVFYCLSLFYPYVKAGLSFWHFTFIVQKFAALICAGEQTWE